LIPALINTLVLVESVLMISVVLGLLIALLIDRPFAGRGLVRVMLISPFLLFQRSMLCCGKT
jgi:sorbitol/mannitol transport system permease protein